MPRNTQATTINRFYQNFQRTLEQFINSYDKQNQEDKEAGVNSLADVMISAVEAQLREQGVEPTTDRIAAARKFAKDELRSYQYLRTKLDLRTEVGKFTKSKSSLCLVVLSVAVSSLAVMVGAASVPAVGVAAGAAILGGFLYTVLKVPAHNVVSSIVRHFDNPEKLAKKVTVTMNEMIGLAFNTKISPQQKIEAALKTIERSDQYITEGPPQLQIAADHIKKVLSKDQTGNVAEVLASAANDLVDASLAELAQKGLRQPSREDVAAARQAASGILLNSIDRRPHTAKAVKKANAKSARETAELDTWASADAYDLSTAISAWANGALAAGTSQAFDYLTGSDIRQARSNMAATTAEMMQEICDKVGKIQKFDPNALAAVASEVGSAMQARHRSQGGPALSTR